MARITPIHKKGEKTNPANYRPISIISVCGKIFEGIVLDNVKNHLNKNDIIVDNQHGFIKGRSTTTNLIKFWEFVTRVVKNNFSVA